MLPYVGKIEFELQPRPTNGPDGMPLLYPRPVPAMKCDLDYIDNYCHEFLKTGKGEIKSLFEDFINAATHMLSSGFRVETPIGSFCIKLKLNGDFSDPDAVKASDVEYAGVEFIPSKRLIKQANPAVHHKGFCKRNTQVGNAQMYNEQAMDVALRQSLKNGYITIKTFQLFSGLKYKSARRYLDSLCEGETPQLRCNKDGGVIHYFPVTMSKSDEQPAI